MRLNAPGRCPVPQRADRRLVVAVVVRDQSAFLSYFLAWHLILGAYHILVYDNGSIAESGMAEVVAPYVAHGVVTVIPVGHQPDRIGKQMACYDDAMGRAATLGAGFLSVLDVDE